MVITNLDSGLIMNLDVKMWPDASSDDVSSNYKVHNLRSFKYPDLSHCVCATGDHFHVAMQKF